MGRRQALSTVGGPVRTKGPERETALLRRALDVPTGEEWRRLTHAFHAYPARMHPDIAARLIQALARPGDRVLDPFVGSGTVLVEALLAGCRGFGVDAHPLAVRIARIKTALWPQADLELLRAEATRVGEAALELARTRGRAPGSERLSRPSEARWFQPHVRWELSNLLAGIASVESSRVRDALEMALSSMLVKVSNQAADSQLAAAPPSLARGFTSRFFVRRAGELATQLGALAAAAPERAFPPRIQEGDARRLRGIGPESVRLIVTSPPYLGTYDYLAHQALRSGLLGIGTRRAAETEIGSRRAATDPERAIATWRDDLLAVLSEMARVLQRGGHALLLIGTSRVGDRLVDSQVIIEELAPRAGLDAVAIASQSRPDRAPVGTQREDGAERPEHLVWLRRPEGAGSESVRGGGAGPRRQAAPRRAGPATPRTGGPAAGRAGGPAPPRGKRGA
ncbi:MAG: hypothetical protein AMXMBFR64_49840 [Myxococcales bacterium]